MNQDNTHFVIGFCVFSLFSLLLCWSCYVHGEKNGRQEGYNRATENFKKELIAKGFAEYNATNGKEWFDKFCVPAMDCDYDFLSSKILSCSYKNKRYYCIGASRLGDVWLSNKLPKEMPCGYNYRVDIEECSDWKIKNR